MSRLSWLGPLISSYLGEGLTAPPPTGLGVFWAFLHCCSHSPPSRPNVKPSSLGTPNLVWWPPSLYLSPNPGSACPWSREGGRERE